jgi:hypothetical protein
MGGGHLLPHQADDQRHPLAELEAPRPDLLVPMPDAGGGCVAVAKAGMLARVGHASSGAGIVLGG